jgi:hypothetical protein
MKTLSIQYLIVYALLILLPKSSINGQSIANSPRQDSYGSSCNLGRQVFVIRNKYVVEFIAPIGWRKDYSQLRSSGIESFYPEIDSVNRETNILVHQSPDPLATLNIDSIILSHNSKYPKEWKIIPVTNKENLFSMSVPNGKLYEIKDNEMNIKEAIAYVYSDNFIMVFNYKPSNSRKYNEFINVYITLLSSIRCSNITRQK